MAVPDVESVASVTDKLRGLLDKAQQSKSCATVNPPLQLSEVFQDAEQARVHGNPTLVKGVLEAAARNIFYDILATHSIKDPDFVNMWNLLDILQYYEDHGQSPAALVLWLLEEMLDSQNIEGCRRVFDYMESRRETLIANNFPRNKDLVILRSCNELLRRLSRAEDAVFCGRVFIFMFLSFPLGDKSSVNPRGDFHVENVTTFELQSSDATSEQPERMDVDETEETPTNVAGATKEGAATSEQQTISQSDIDTLYPIFWSLQQAFSNPTRLFLPETFDGFKRGMELTLKRFQEVPTVISGDKLGVGRKHGNETDDFASTFNPKYLTSRDLFRLELSDLAFQRHILVQALILIDFLLSLTEKSKTKVAESVNQRALRYPYTLTDEDASWALGIKHTIVNYLQEGPDGKFYHRMVEVVLSRDKNWVRWKLESCPEIKRAPASAEIFQDALSGARGVCVTKKLRSAPLKSLNLAFLSGSADSNGMEGLKNPSRIAIPKPEDFVTEIQTVDLDLEMAVKPEEVEELQAGKLNRTWLALRVAARDRLNRFDKVDDGRSIEKLTETEPIVEARSTDAVNCTEQSNEEPSSTEAPGDSSVAEQVGEGQSEKVEEVRAGSTDQPDQVMTETVPMETEQVSSA